jgi:hypothetical protein
MKFKVFFIFLSIAFVGRSQKQQAMPRTNDFIKE